ncbi:MAG: peptidase M16, partial [Deltaproteobacteria bacterium]|nr:peptidase M16 [Deltaproteobacteria bacterium]
RHEQRLIPSGHQVVDVRLRAHYDEAGWFAEEIRGVSQLLFLRELAVNVDGRWHKVLADLEEIRALLVNRTGMLANVTLDGKGWARFQPEVEGLLEEIPAKEVVMGEWSPARPEGFEGFAVPTRVNYVGKGLNLYEHGYGYHGSARVVTRYLRNTWLWDRIRVQGGAYGAFCLLDRLSGVLTFVSYRDPNLKRTIEAFDEAADFLENIQLGQDELTKAVIGAIGDMDQVQLPDAKGYTSMARFLSGVSDDERQKIREEVLGAGQEDFRSFGRILREGMGSGLVKVLGSEAAMQEAMAGKPDWLRVKNLL